jgi:hypothetical protein
MPFSTALIASGSRTNSTHNPTTLLMNGLSKILFVQLIRAVDLDAAV